MARVLIFAGIGCCFVAALTGLISLDVDGRGLSEVNPLGALALAAAALACFRGAEVIDAQQRLAREQRPMAPPHGR
ncbi:MAG: hypothetical protein K0V04_18935 [Deltaproteobacteria bacterium]|nr:hypothetical protein [Deltaproteobacteria bacterium]